MTPLSTCGYTIYFLLFTLVSSESCSSLKDVPASRVAKGKSLLQQQWLLNPTAVQEPLQQYDQQTAPQPIAGLYQEIEAQPYGPVQQFPPVQTYSQELVSQPIAGLYQSASPVVVNRLPVQQYAPLQQLPLMQQYPAMQTYVRQSVPQPMVGMYQTRGSPPSAMVNSKATKTPAENTESKAPGAQQNSKLQKLIKMLSAQHKRWNDKFTEVESWVRDSVLDGSIAQARHETELMQIERALRGQDASSTLEEKAHVTKQFQQQQETSKKMSTAIHQGSEALEHQSAREFQSEGNLQNASAQLQQTVFKKEVFPEKDTQPEAILQDAAAKLQQALLEKEALSKAITDAKLFGSAAKKVKAEATDEAQNAMKSM